AQASLDRGQIADLGQVSLENINGDVVFLTQPRCKSIQPLFVAGNQYEVVPALCKALGIGSADASGGAGNENGGRDAHELILSSDIDRRVMRGVRRTCADVIF